MITNSEFPPDVPSAPDEDESRLAKQNAAWALDRRRQIRLAATVAALLGLLTLYFAGLNIYVLYHSQPQAYSIEISSFAAADVADQYQVFVRWEPTGTQPGRHPALLLGNAAIPVVGASTREPAPAANARMLRIDAEHASAGLHRGELVLTKAKGRMAAMPDQAAVPISVSVSRGIWSSWFVLRDWLIVLALLAVMLYIFCVLYFPAQSGVLVVLVYRGGHGRRRSLKLGLDAVSRLCPWRRSTVSFRRICRQVGTTQFLRGEIVFVGHLVPVLVAHGRPERLQRRRSDREPLDDSACAAFEPCGALDTMYESITYRVAGPGENDFTLFRFSTRQFTHDGVIGAFDGNSL